MGDGVRTLLVEDEANMVRTLSRILSRRGFLVDAAGSGTEALHRLEDGDLLLADGGADHEGWAGAVTRTWPVNGRFSPTQRAIYEIVLQAQFDAIDREQEVAHRDVDAGLGER